MNAFPLTETTFSHAYRPYHRRQPPSQPPKCPVSPFAMSPPTSSSRTVSLHPWIRRRVFAKEMESLPQSQETTQQHSTRHCPTDCPALRRLEHCCIWEASIAVKSARQPPSLMRRLPPASTLYLKGHRLTHKQTLPS